MLSQIDGCPCCAAALKQYSADCRGCLIRRIAHAPIKLKGDIYKDLTRKYGEEEMQRISQEVARWYRLNHSYGTFV